MKVIFGEQTNFARSLSDIFFSIIADSLILHCRQAVKGDATKAFVSNNETIFLLPMVNVVPAMSHALRRCRWAGTNFPFVLTMSFHIFILFRHSTNACLSPSHFSRRFVLSLHLIGL